MKPYPFAAMIFLAIFAAFWAMSIGYTLTREFGLELSFYDIGALYVLGFISGIALGLAHRIKVRRNI